MRFSSQRGIICRFERKVNRDDLDARHRADRRPYSHDTPPPPHRFRHQDIAAEIAEKNPVLGLIDNSRNRNQSPFGRAAVGRNGVTSNSHCSTRCRIDVCVPRGARFV